MKQTIATNQIVKTTWSSVYLIVIVHSDLMNSIIKQLVKDKCLAALVVDDVACTGRAIPQLIYAVK